MPLTTRCGRCGRLFPVYAQELKDRRGRVHCPQCGNRFDGLAALVDEPMLERQPGDARGRLGLPRTRPGQSPPRQATPRPGIPGATPPVPAPGAPGARGRRLVARLGWGLAALLLLLALPLQVAWWMRAELLQEPEIRSRLAALCERLGCEVPAPRIPGTMAVVEPSLTPDPETGALVLALAIRNAAALPQPAPLLELEIFDGQGETIAARRFAPADYGLAEARLLLPGETVPATVAIRPPGVDTSGFKVRLL